MNKEESSLLTWLHVFFHIQLSEHVSSNCEQDYDFPETKSFLKKKNLQPCEYI